MKGFIKLPTYTDPECTNFYKNIKVMVLDWEEGIEMYNSVVTIDGVRVTHTGINQNPTGHRKSGFVTTYPISFVGGSTTSPETAGKIRAYVKSRMAAYFNAASIANESVFDEFNLAGFSRESGTYYLKNGSKIVATVEDFEYQGSTAGPGLFLDFYNPSGTRVFGVGTSSGYDTKSIATAMLFNPPYVGYRYGQNVIGSFGMMKEAAIAAGSYNVQCGVYTFFYVFGEELNSYDYDRMSIRTDGSGYRYVDYQNLLPSRIVQGSYPQACLYRFLGATPTNKNILDLVEDAEYRDDTEDADNTYPGGGDDKNTYPLDGESGKGTFDNTNDPVDFPSMPLWDATSTGFISMWNPTIAEITQLYSFLWDSDISTTLKKLFLEPMDAIISLAFFPVDPVNFPEKRNVTIGHVDTEITMYAVQKQFVDFDFGTIKLDEYYGAAWDYSPYTKVSIYLPYIGSQELDVDDVMNATLHLQYRIDLLSGMCAAMLKCTRDRDDLDAVVYTWQGNCAMQVPITAGSAREFINSIIQLGAMTGLALVQPAAGALAMGTGDFSMSADIMAMKNNFVNPTMATYAALNVLGQKVHVQRGGRVDANAGVMSPQSAYLIIDRPISAIPKGWNEYAGYPSLKIKALSTQKGMTQVAYIKLNGLEATAEEISELDSILKAGVIL